MPSQHIGTFLTTKELELVEATLKKTGITRYKLFKNAIREFCEAKLKEEVEHDRGREETSPKRGKDSDKDREPREESGLNNSLDNDIY